jgi:hypothetical protein
MRSGAVLGATDTADEMAGHPGHRQTLRQVEAAGVKVEITRRLAIAAVAAIDDYLGKR